MDDEELQRIYEAHRLKGASVEEAEAAVALAQQGGETSPELEAQKRLSADGGSKWGDLGHMMAQGGTFGFADELKGLLGGDTTAERQKVEDLKQLNPGWTGGASLATMAGGVLPTLIPVGAGLSAVRGGGGVVRAAGAGALGGAVQGGLTGLGEAEGSVENRLPAAEKGAAFGAAAGAVLGTIPAIGNAFARAGKGTPKRLTDLLRSTTGIEDDLYTATSRNELKKAVAGADLGALDAANPSVTDPRVLAALDADRFARKAVKAVEPGGFGPSNAPSLEQIRTVRQELKDAAERAARKPRTTVARGYREARGELTEAVDKSVPGFKDANRAYAQTISREEGLGTKLASKTADEIKLAMEGQYPEMQEGMRTRLVNDVASSINEGGGKWVQGMVSQNPGTLAKIRNAFPDDDAGSESFRKLLKELALEESSARTRTFAKGAGRTGAWIGGGGAAAYGLSRLLGGSPTGRP